MRTETVPVVTSDGLTLAADFVRPPAEPWGAAVVCHPHPLFGGNRHNPVVGTLVEALAGAGLTTVRFDFRGAGGSPGHHDDGRGELLDVLGALDATSALGTVPIVLAGYSFGALMALQVTDERIAGWLAVAPPLRPGAPLAARADPRPKHLLVPAHDQYCPPDVAREVVAGWAGIDLVEVPMADHFLAGAHRLLTAEATTFATSLLPR